MKNSFKKNKENISVKTENTRMHKSFIRLSNFLSLVSIYLSLLPPYLPVYLPWHLNIIYLYRSFSKSLYPLAVSSLSKSFQPMILDTRISGNCSGWSVSLQIKVNFMSRQNLTCFQSKLLFLENIEKNIKFRISNMQPNKFAFLIHRPTSQFA